MSVRIGHSSIDENGKISGGTAGDQTGKEVCIRDYYSKPWDYMAIHPDPDVREKHAACCEDACNNNNIGYDQNQRNTLHPLAVAAGFNYAKISTPCECDCSSFQNSLAVASGAPGVTYGSNGWTTYTMKAALQAAGYVIITNTTYVNNAKYCVRGAIYVKESSHTACGLDNGSDYLTILKAAGLSTSGSGNTKTVDELALEVIAGKWGDGSTRESSLTASGYDYSAVRARVNEILGAGSSSASASTNSTPAATSAVTASEKAYYRDASLTGAYTVTTQKDGLNVRDSAGTGTKNVVLVTLPKGTKVQNYGYYNLVSGVKWLYIQVTYNGVVYTGFASSEFLTKA